MSQQARHILCLPFTAPSAVAQYRAVDYTGAQITVAGSRIAGVSKRPAAIGELFEATAIGTAVIEAGAAITLGAPLAIDATGRAVPASSLTVAAGATAVTSSAANGAILAGGVTPQYVIGGALQAATAAGQFIEMLLTL